MELYAKGQLSYLILTCMKDRDFYGLDIISEISDRSNGRIKLKKPSVYSNLTRMEKQGYISSYLKSSDVGPNRKYYSLTEKGRNFYAELQEYFDRNNIDVFKDFADGEDNTSLQSSIDDIQSPVAAEHTVVTTVDESEEQPSEEDGFFDFSFADETQNETQQEKVDIDVDSEQEFDEKIEQAPEMTAHESSEQKLDIQGVEIVEKDQPEQQETSIVEDVKNDAVFLDKEDALEYNKRLYDISKDLNKYRKKRSFAEDQISMTATAPLANAQEKQKNNLEEFKVALTANKIKYQDKRINQEDFARQMQYRYDRPPIFEKAQQSSVEDKVKDDSVFITNRISESDVEKAKKIEPPRLKVNTELTRETKLPAPKRDASIDPSHKEILTQLYAKTRDNSSSEVREDSIYDYNDLKDYYHNQNISFNIYQKSAGQVKHNTNKLYFVISMITFFVACGLSAVLFAILSAANMLNATTNFLFIVLPALLIIDLIVKIYKLQQSSGWMPKKILPQWAVWGIFFIISGVVIGLNFAFGLSGISFGQFATTLILPIVLAFVAIVARYYLKRILFVKFWR